MTEVKSTFSPSVNIERDDEKSFEYVVTPNSKSIYEQILRSLDTGVHSFSIIGSYGTGKSSFLLAFIKNLRGEQHFFSPLNGEFKNVESVEFDTIVGSYGSFIDALRNHFDLTADADEKEILKKIADKQEAYKEENRLWFLIVDEFGKYLEYAAKEDPDRELYFIQLLSEYANDADRNFFLINTLHQAFDSYALGLDAQQRKEWDKVRGRLKELAFNEPVEQLIFIASQHLKGKEISVAESDLSELHEAIVYSKVFPLKSDLNLSLAKSLYPLDPLAASVLALSLQHYGQNERSLFYFLESEEQFGINHYRNDHYPFFSITNVYDYLIYNYHSVLSSKYNPHYVQWNALKSSIERVEGVFDQNIPSYKSVVKTIGLLNIFGASGAKVDKKFLESYLSIVSGLENVNQLLEDLEKKKIIRFRSFKDQYILFEGTDYDIEFELQNAAQKVEPVKDVVPYLKKYFSFPFISAKKTFYETGTPRYFEFIISDNVVEKPIKQPIDGVINLVFSSTIDSAVLKTGEDNRALLVGIYTNTDEVRNQIFEIHKVDYLLDREDELDKVARRELNALKASLISDLNDAFLNSIYDDQGIVKWIFNGKVAEINDQREFNSFLSTIIDEVYPKTPIYKNELINRHKVSPAVYRPRKDLLRRVIDYADQPDLGFDESFPAEKTIYLSLLKYPGLHRRVDGVWGFYPPEKDSNLYSLWEFCEEFFQSTVSGTKPVTDLISELQKPPMGLKNGFVELWVPLYLLMKDGDYALFHEGAFVPDMNFDVLNLVFRNPKLFEIKAYHISDVKKKLFSKYRDLQGKDESDEFSNKSFIETIRPFLLTYNELNEYGRKTNSISPQAIKLREAIKTATDPEKVFFDEFPLALGYHSLDDLDSDEAIQQFIYQLDKAIEEIKSSYAELLNKLEQCLLAVLEIDSQTSFKGYSTEIQKRFSSIKKYRLVDRQKKLLNRLLSELNDRDKWLNSVGLSVLDKPLSKIKDEEEEVLFSNLESRIEELEALIDLSEENIDQESELGFNIKITPLGDTPIKQNLKVSKKILVEEKDKLEHIRSSLTGNKKKDLTLLIKLIEEITSDE
ncbi:hypothetical protein AB2B38_008340 [Balneola sp. MJW-20]|uniref:hypothetical protein n=1 Tax=Gracilimonas aurantiaca TaxID=3234185 RepID=UPI0034656F1D